MIGDYQKGRKPLVRAYVQPQREPALFNTTGGVSYYLHKCGLYDDPENGESFRPSRRYRNLSDNMSNLQNSFSNGNVSGRAQNSRCSNTPKVLARFTSGAECVADLTRCCPSYCSSGFGTRSRLGSSASFSRANTSFNRNANLNRSNAGSMFIGSPSMIDSKSTSQFGTRQRPVMF